MGQANAHTLKPCAARPAESVSDSIGQLTNLRALALSGNGNRLTALPPGLGFCLQLEEADLAGNAIAALPEGLSRLTALKSLLLDKNRCAGAEGAEGPGGGVPLLPKSSQGSALLRLDTACSPLNLPFCPCRIKAVPPGILTGCVALQTLSLHGNPVSAEQMRETPGFAAYNARRKAKHDKGLCMRLGQSFDEGFDAVEYERYK